MNKKYVSYIIAVVLCLNLLPQTCNAFKLNEAKTDITYHNDEEKKEWETFYLPYAKHLRLVNKKTTMLELAKMAEKEADEENLLADIMNRTIHERDKLLVKWERDNGYIAEEVEEARNITPTKRLELLQEVREEEEKEAEKKEQFRWKVGKTIVAITSFLITFGVAKYNNQNVKESIKWAGSITSGLGAFVSCAEVAGSLVFKKVRRLWKGEDDEEIKLPPLRNMPVLPKDYKRVDVWTYGL